MTPQDVTGMFGALWWRRTPLMRLPASSDEGVRYSAYDRPIVLRLEGQEVRDLIQVPGSSHHSGTGQPWVYRRAYFMLTTNDRHGDRRRLDGHGHFHLTRLRAISDAVSEYMGHINAGPLLSQEWRKDFTLIARPL